MSFDVFSSHNANSDDGATTDAWNALATGAGALPMWSSENPRAWSESSTTGLEIGVKAVVAANVRGLVIYEAFPACVAVDGTLTDKGSAIAAGILP